jgi:glutamyl-tRNA synthetase/glutamyl-Q tRNA(Asp) synthetase
VPLEDGVGVRVVLADEPVEFEDLLLGVQRQSPAEQSGDLLLRDATGNWTYQFCVTVDDLRHDVDLVVRGEDLLASTGRQIMLAGLLGRATPARFLHHPLIRNAEGIKLSKRDGVVGVRALRALGRKPVEVIGEAAWRTGLLPVNRPIRPSELGGLFLTAVDG